MRNKVFHRILKANQTELKDYLYAFLKGNGYEVEKADGFLYTKGNHPVLLVAHMDTVHTSPVKEIIYKGNQISSPQGLGGDDRNGVYMITEIIREVHCSVLFLEDEEIGCIGAQKFCAAHKEDELGVNYIIEFDRRNFHDAVYYDLDSPEFEDFIMESSDGHFITAFGSCSDISYIAPDFGIAAVNLSCGYYKEHKPDTYTLISEMETNISKAKEIILTPVDRPFKYRAVDPWDYYGYDYGAKSKRYCGNDYAVKFMDKDGATAINIVEAFSDIEALGYTMLSFGWLNADRVSEIGLADDTSVWDVERYYEDGEEGYYGRKVFDAAEI